jgi:hypothetical protein
MCYNLTGRQAKEWLRQVQRFLDLMKDDPDFGWNEKERNKSEFIVIECHRTPGVTSSIHAYCGASRSSNAMVITVALPFPPSPRP